MLVPERVFMVNWPPHNGMCTFVYMLSLLKVEK